MMRALLLVTLLAACSHTAPPPVAPAPAPTPEPAPAPVAEAPAPAPTPPAAGGGWYCFTSTSAKDGSSLTTCERSEQQCKTDVDEQMADPDQQGDTWTSCSAQATAFCFNFVPHDGGNALSMCEGTFSQCDQFRSHLDAASNADPDKWAQPGSVTACSELE